MPLSFSTSLRALGMAVAMLVLGSGAARAELLVFAAASTTNAVEDVIAAFTAETGIGAVPSFASSSVLAKQIAQGAPAGVFISANPKWMDYLETAQAVRADSRRDLLGNRLVLVTPATSDAAPQITAGLPLADMLGDRRLALGDPSHVPAGIYAKQALLALGLWDAVAGKVAPANDVRGALALVARGETPFGIVYATDAAMSKKVRVAATFPADSHPPITYPVALTTRADADAEAFLDFLFTPQAEDIFRRYGFSLP